jgi:hypothetical protein
MISRIRRPTAARTAVTALAAFALALSLLALPSDDSTARVRHKPKPPAMYWGGWIGSQFTGSEAPKDMNAVGAFQGLLGKPLSLIEWATPWANCNVSPCYFIPFPVEDMQKVRDYGAIPFLSWSSAMIPGDVNQPDFQLSDVISGRYDSYIANFANAARDWGHPFFLRFDWEMNGDWFSWSEGVNGNQPGEYVAAWRHVHDIFTSVGATNATWVWCPLVTPRNTLAKLRSWYPGHSYVDWTCLDGYNWGPTPVNPHPWRSFHRIFKTDYKRVVKKIARKKPMILAELGSNSAGGNKGRWIRKMFKILPTDYRRVRALIWFDIVDRNIDWPLETSPGATAAFSRGIRPRRFYGNSLSNFNTSPIPAPPRP